LFTGLVEAVGTVRALKKHSRGARLAIESALKDLLPGESISVNGVCQTIAETSGGVFSCDVLPETLRVSNIGSLRSGSRVNLERALVAGARLGGHLVNGHVDGVGTVTAVIKKPLSLGISVEPTLLTYIVPKGSVAVNGVSLTIGGAVRNGRFTVFIIPHTWEGTNLKDVTIGSTVNIEIDIIAKYVERLCLHREGK
jgi:riboflavin synthase